VKIPAYFIILQASMTSALIWFFAWTPYAITTMVPFLGEKKIIIS